MINYFVFQSTLSGGTPAFITVVDYDEARNFSDFCESVYKELPESDRLKTTFLICRLPVSIPTSRTLLANLCADAKAANLPAGQALLESIQEAIIDEGSFLHRRFGHVHVSFLYSDNYEILLSDTCTPFDRLSVTPLTDTEKSDLCAAIRQFELRQLAELSRAIFPPIQNTPYRTPAGDMANRFIRVGNIQRSRPSIHAFFFWMLPHLRSSGAILADTWSISSIAYNASRLLARYRGSGAIPRVDMLSEYHTAGEGALNLNLDVLRRFLRGPTAIRDGEEVTFLLSAVNTGRLLTRIKTTLASEGIDLDKVRFLTLYRLQSGFDGEFLSDLSDLNFQYRSPPSVEAVALSADPAEAVNPGVALAATSKDSPVSLAAEETPTQTGQTSIVDGRTGGEPSSGEGTLPTTPWIEIDPATYFPKLVSEVEIKVRDGTVKRDRDVYNTYGSLGAFLVHRTIVDDRAPRHHGVFVDTGKLITSPGFRVKLADYLATLKVVPSLVVAPEHYRAARLVDLVIEGLQTRFGVPVTKVFHPNLYFDPNRETPQDRDILARFYSVDENAEIMIVDDAFVTGTRLFQYSQHLRYVGDGYKGRVHFLVAIARPPAITRWEEAKELLSYRPRRADGMAVDKNTVTAIETIVLPNWNEMECPWCIESGRLRDYAALETSMLPLFQQRLKFLGEKIIEGMTGQLYLEAPGSRPIRITEGSIFTRTAVDQASAFAAVAGGLQRLRTDRNNVRLGPHRYPLATVLDSSEYLQLVYNDSALRGAFFRAAHREELCYHDPRKEAERAEFCQNLIRDSSGEVNNLALEFCWQVMEGKLPENLFDLCGIARFVELGIENEIRYLVSILNH